MLIATFAYNLLMAVVYGLNTFCLGYVLSLPLTKHLDSALLKFILRSALGWNVLVFLIHILGIVSFLNTYTYFGLLIIGLILYLTIEIKNCRVKLTILREIINKYWQKGGQLFKNNKLLIGSLVVFVSLLLIIALAPVSKTDELNYYYYFVKRIVVNHAILFDYYPLLSFQPMAQQLWYVPVYGLSAHEAPAILNIFTSLLILVVSYFWLRKYMESKYAWLAVTAIYINLNAISIYPAPQDNVAAWLWGLVALILTYEFLLSGKKEQGLNTNILILGLIYSTAYLAKLTNLPLVFLGVLVIVFKLIQNKCWKKILYLSLPASIFIVPFLIRTYFWTGNPFFPLLTNLFGGTMFDANAVSAYLANLARTWPSGLGDIILALINEIVYNLKWNASPLLILLSPLGWFYLIRKKFFLIAAISIALIIIATLTATSHRLTVGILMFSVLALFIHGKKFIENKYVIVLVKLHIGIIFVAAMIYSFQFGRYVLGFENKAEFFKNKVQTYAEIQWANAHLLSSAIILTNTWELYNFNFQTYSLNEYPLLIGADARKLQTTKDIYIFLKDKKITHLFLTKAENSYNQIFEEDLGRVGETYGKLIYESDQATIRGYRYPIKKPLKGKVLIYELL